MKLRFWPFIIGVFITLWGIVSLFEALMGIRFPKVYDTYILSSFAVAIGLWFVWRATIKPD